MDAVIHENVARIQQRIAEAAMRAGREPESVQLIAVTKAVGIEEVWSLYRAGLRTFAENRFAVGRKNALSNVVLCDISSGGEGADIKWHMIGHVQRRKARLILQYFDTVDSIDRLALATAFQRRCEEADTTLDCLVEVNVSGEESKHGFTPQELEQALHAMSGFDRLNIQGLMTMAPWGAPEEVIRDVFRGLKALADNNGLNECSMGMTDDFEIAIEEGATQVRIGRALFEKPTA